MPSVTVAGVAALVAIAVAGRAAATGLLVGGMTAALFFVVGFVAVRLVLAGAPSFFMVGALAVYAGQVLLLFAASEHLAALHVQARPFALGAFLVVLAWQAGQAAVLLRRRTLIYDADLLSDASTSTGPSSAPARVVAS